MPNEEEELRELKSMFARRPAWDSTPLRNRPPALVGLKPVTREPWAIDEDVYNRRFETRDVGVPDRYLDQTARRKQHNTTVIESYNAFNMKFEEGDGGHGQGGVLGGDDVRKPLEPTSSPPPKKMASKPTTPMTGAGGKQRAPAKAKSPVRSPPKQAPRGPRALAADKRRREAEAAVWGRSRMEQEKQLRGMTAF